MVRDDKADEPNAVRVLDAEGAGAAARQPQGHPGGRDRGRGVVPPLYDHCTVKYLNQAGMKVEWMPLDKVGIHGNGHMVMIEKNNLAIAKVIDDWAKKNVK